jgi:hypothetical protein
MLELKILLVPSRIKKFVLVEKVGMRVLKRPELVINGLL